MHFPTQSSLHRLTDSVAFPYSRREHRWVPRVAPRASSHPHPSPGTMAQQSDQSGRHCYPVPARGISSPGLCEGHPLKGPPCQEPHSAGTWSSLTLGEDLILLTVAQAFPDHPLFFHFAVFSPGHPLQPPPALKKNHPARGNLSVIFLSPQYLPRPKPKYICILPEHRAPRADNTGSLQSFQGPARCL